MMESAFLRKAWAVLKARLVLLEQNGFSGGLPGAELSHQVVRDFAEATYSWGVLHAELELRRTRGWKAQFADPPKPKGPTPTGAIEWAQSRAQLQGKWDRALDDKVNAVVVQALQEGLTNREVVKRLGQVLPGFTKARLENIARTETASAYTAGRLATFQGSKIIMAVQFTAVVDDRTTEICRARDGKIMMLDDPDLPANTPPLHFQCRSTLVGVDRYDLIDLQNGDPEVEARYFAYLEDGPKNYREATDWSRLPDPLRGFGQPVQASGGASVPPATPTPSPAPQAQPTTLKDRVTGLLGQGTLGELRAAGAVLRQEILADTEPDWAKRVVKVLGQVKDFNTGPAPRFKRGTRVDAKNKVLAVWDKLPGDWQLHLAQREIGVGIYGARANFDFLDWKINLRRGNPDNVTLHEVGHWMEFSSTASTGFFEKSKEFLADRTAGEQLRTLRSLTGIRYRANEVARPDQFTNPYVGKDYSIGGRIFATEVLSMGLEAVFYQQHGAWARDPDLIDFILAALVYCRP